MKENHFVEKGLTIVCILLLVWISIIPSTAQRIEKSSLATSSGHWLYVGGSGLGNYTRIQDAINDSDNGDTVYVYDDSSPYHENLVIHQTSLTLLGENKQTTVLVCKVHEIENRVIVVGGDFVCISGFTIKEEKFSYLYFSIGANNIQVSDNIIIGIELVLPAQTYQCKISNNVIKGNHSTEGIHVWGKQNTISDNVITECGNGIFVGYGGISLHVKAYGNIITRNNFLNNKKNAEFDTAWFTRWVNNYWDDSQEGVNPYEIQGKITFPRGEDKLPWIFDWKNFDRHPAKEPYNISGMS